MILFNMLKKNDIEFTNEIEKKLLKQQYFDIVDKKNLEKIILEKEKEPLFSGEHLFF